MNDKRLSHVPAPSAYTVPTTDKTSKASSVPKWSQSKEQRFQSHITPSKQTPGPGEYRIPSKVVEGPKYTTRVKPKIDPFKMKSDPGPGFYDPPTSGSFKKISYSLTGIAHSSIDKTTPGPGSYNSTDQLHYKTLTGSKIGKDKRKSFFLQTSITGKPDSGLYEKPGFEKLNNQTFSFGKS